jgi:Uma2 family endonuclease
VIGLALSAVLRMEADWVVVDTPKLKLDGTAMTPAIAGWRRENAQRSVPDWVCHVPHTNDSPTNVRKMFAIYERAGVKHVWLFDPLSRQLEAYGGPGNWKFLAGYSSTDGKTSGALVPFDNVTINFASLWGR